MVKYSAIYFNTRNLIPIMSGVIIGFTLSLFCISVYDCDNQLLSNTQTGGHSNYQFNLMRLKKNLKQTEEFNELQQKQKDDYEPRINLKGKPKEPQKSIKKPVRSRYISTELNMRQQLFVGVVSTSRVLSKFATFSNQTISPYADRVTFFNNNPGMNEQLLLDTTPPGINVVNFNDPNINLLPFHTLKYVVENHIDFYDWYFFVTDKTYVRASKVNFNFF